MAISYLYMMMQLLFMLTYLHLNVAIPKLTDSGFGASDQFMLETTSWKSLVIH
jgi:hypothetical protein